MLMQSTLSLLPKEKDHRVRVMGILSAVEHIFTDTAMHARAQVSNRLAKANRPNNNECRERIRTTIERTLTGTARMNAYKDSVAETERVKERKGQHDKNIVRYIPCG